jgi:hypothetical protein
MAADRASPIQHWSESSQPNVLLKGGIPSVMVEEIYVRYRKISKMRGIIPESRK